MKTINILFAAAVMAVLTATACNKALEPYDHVDVKIGTGGHGHVFVGASVPFGMVQIGPTSIPQTWDWCSGYHDSDSSVIGFSHTHLSGTGIGDLFDVTVMPVVGNDLEYSREGLASQADRANEIAEPAYYSVPLARYGILAEMTATRRVGLERFTFPKDAEAAAVVFNLQDGGCFDRPDDVAIEVIDDRHIEGHRHSKGWADDQKLYFAAEFSEPFSAYEQKGEMFWRFDFDKPSSVLVKVALSPFSVEGARDNLAAELPGWDFDAVRDAARVRWNYELGRIKIETENEARKQVFYTAMYHTMIMPSLFSDYGQPDRYTALSLWDTYRALMPLYTITQPEREVDIINTFLDIYDKQGDLPVWHLMGCETDCMVGNPAIPIVADAMMKGFNGFNKMKAYEAMKATALTPDRLQDVRMKYGYIPFDIHMRESVAFDMEYAIADAALAEVAMRIGEEEDYEYFLERSHSYRHYFDPQTKFMRGVNTKGEFYEPFNPFYSGKVYTEGNAWQYLWLVPHDLKGLEELFEQCSDKNTFLKSKRTGRTALISKLDSLFLAPSDAEGTNNSSDVSGLIGQYAHGNEPSHHVAYFYTMLGQPWKTADLVRRISNELYTTGPEGLCGNEDAGQMSAWYILSSLGFYQVVPAGGCYWFGSPLFDKASISLPGGKVFTVTAEGNSDTAKYIKRVWLNGRPYTKPYIDYQKIMAGGELRFEMSEKPALWYCADEPERYETKRPKEEDRLFRNETIEAKISEVWHMLTNYRLKWMFANCFPNTLDTTVNFREDDGTGKPDTFVITGDIFAMWLRDSGAQVWPYVRFAAQDEQIRKMIEGTVRRQFFCLSIDPYANAFNFGPTGGEWQSDDTDMNLYDHERKWEIDSQCYPIRLAYEYWKTTGDASVFDDTWVKVVDNILSVLREQQKKEGKGSYHFLRSCDRQYDMKCNYGYGNPVNPVGLIASAFRPSDDATVLDFLIPSNFFAVTSLRKAAEILTEVNNDDGRASQCRALADEVEAALKKYAVVDTPEFGKIYAFEVDGFGNRYLMDDANVPSLLAMAYLGDVSKDDPIYQNTRKFVLSSSNPYRFEGATGIGIGGPHIGPDYIWPMSIMMRAFTSDDDDEILECILQLMATDAGTGMMHESFHKDDPTNYTRDWFAWQNTLFGELILKLIDDGKLDLLNSII